MQPGREIKGFPSIDFEHLQKVAPALDIEIAKRLVLYLNEQVRDRRAPLYVFLNPDLPSVASQVQCPIKEAFFTLKFLSNLYGQFLRFKAILIRDDLFYILQDLDLKEVEEENIVHHPEDPRIVYRDADKILRHAFVMGLPTATYEYF